MLDARYADEHVELMPVWSDLMAIYPEGQWRPLAPGVPNRLMSSYDIICIHTMAGYLLGTEAMFQQAGWQGTEAHFGIGGPADGDQLDGEVYQWVDTAFQADANLDGTPRIISVETSDGGDPERPWSPRQLEAIVRIILWCHDEHGIPVTLIEDSQLGRTGIGYHRQGIDPWRVPNGELWSNAVGKVCPGDVRIAQLIDTVIPWVTARDAGIPVPSVTEVVPNRGIAGEDVRILGTGFDAAIAVYFDNTSVETWSIGNDEELIATAPEALISGPARVTVASDAGNSGDVTTFTYQPAHTLIVDK